MKVARPLPQADPESASALDTLLAAVLTGLFGMHVLTDGDNASGHGDLAPVGAAVPSSSSNLVMTGMPRASDSDPAVNTSSVAVIPAVSAAPTVPGWYEVVFDVHEAFRDHPADATVESEYAR